MLVSIYMYMSVYIFRCNFREWNWKIGGKYLGIFKFKFHENIEIENLWKIYFLFKCF